MLRDEDDDARGSAAGADSARAAHDEPDPVHGFRASFQSRCGWVESNAIESPGPSSRSVNPICTFSVPEIT